MKIKWITQQFRDISRSLCLLFNLISFFLHSYFTLGFNLGFLCITSFGLLWGFIFLYLNGYLLTCESVLINLFLALNCEKLTIWCIFCIWREVCHFIIEIHKIVHLRLGFPEVLIYWFHKGLTWQDSLGEDFKTREWPREENGE